MFIRRCKSLGTIDMELACQVNQCEQYWKSLLPATFGFCQFIAERGLALRGDDENAGSPRNIFQANFQNFFPASF